MLSSLQLYEKIVSYMVNTFPLSTMHYLRTDESSFMGDERRVYWFVGSNVSVEIASSISRTIQQM